MPNAAAWADSLLDSWGSRGMGGCLGQTLSSTVRCGQKRDSDGPDSLGRFSPIPSQESLLTSTVAQCADGHVSRGSNV